jgi:Mg/Co/Ni transporter MgtE (contains CBS domain)
MSPERAGGPGGREKRSGTTPDEMVVTDIMSTDFIRVLPDTPVETIATHFSARGCSDLVVTDNRGHFLGVITPYDLLTAVSPEAGIRSRKRATCIECLISGSVSSAADLMTRSHITVKADTLIPEAIRLLERHRHPDLVVINDGGEVIGVIGICNIISHLRIVGHL